VTTAVPAYLLVLAVAAGGTYALTWVWRALAPRFGAVKQPRERDLHQHPTRDAGGIAMYVAFLLSVFAAWRIPYFDGVFRDSSEPLGVVLAATIVFAVGFIDDLRDLSAPAKLAGLVLGGTVMYFLGVSMFYFRIPFADFVVLSPDFAVLATVLWVVVMANAVNWIDGLDGLAAGVVAIAAAAFTIYAQRLSAGGLLAPENIGPLLAVIACGVCLGFLPHNFHPAKIFMGDSGALFLGLLMAASTLVIGGRIADQFSGQTYFFYAPIFIPVFILGVPMVDVVTSILRRARKRTGVATADTEHLHHRLMRLGHGQRRSVLILWTWTALLSAFVLYPTIGPGGTNLLPFAVAALGVALYTLFHPGVRRRPEDEPTEEHPAVDSAT